MTIPLKNNRYNLINKLNYQILLMKFTINNINKYNYMILVI